MSAPAGKSATTDSPGGTAVSPARPGPAATKLFEEVAVGDELPPLSLPLTRTLIVSTAIASRDYQDVHHDSVLAVERGSKDIFMNILSTNGIVGRFVTDWSGPGAVLTDVNIRLGAPNHPDDTMHLTGSVTAKDDSVGADGKGGVEVTLRGANGMGDHVTGTVRLRLPSSSGTGSGR
jgi:hypothetical protein